MKNIPEEILPLLDWWEQNGKQAMTYLLIAAVAIGGYYGVKTYRANRRAAASTVLTSSYTASELEDGVAKYDGTSAGPAIRLRLAKKYFDDERYQEALDMYSSLSGKLPAAFADIPQVGIAHCLEAQEKFAEAQKAFEDFANANPTSYLALTARLGAVRALAAGGDKAGALAKLDAMKAEFAGKDDALARIEKTKDLVTRWEKRALRSLFDAANDAAKTLEAEAAKPAEDVKKEESK